MRWRAFESDKDRASKGLWAALWATCNSDKEEYQKWLDVLLWYRWGDA